MQMGQVKFKSHHYCRMASKEITSLLVIIGIGFLVFVLLNQHADCIVRNRIEMKEPFEDTPQPPVTGVVDEMRSATAPAPAPADIDNQRQPYHLLRGVLPDATTDAPSNLSAERCYDGDYMNRLEKTQNFAQHTNNYKRATPDSCSAPLSVFVNSFYKVSPVA